MAKYEPGDLVTYYFVVHNDGSTKQIVGYTDNKDLAKVYIDFHACKSLTLKSVTKRIETINSITEENWNDEIGICNIVTRNRDKRRKGEEAITITIPATRTETTFIKEEEDMFMASQVRYSYLRDVIPYLKDKYIDALDDIFLTSIIAKVCDQVNRPDIQSLRLDQLMVLFRMQPDKFGK